jgi:hypothetical protein
LDTRTILGIVAAILAVTVFLVALRIKLRASAATRLRPDDRSDVLAFDITEQAAGSPLRAWTARYRTAEEIDEFDIEMLIAEPVPPSPFAEGTVSFRRVPGSGGAALLSDLSRALGLHAVPSAGSPADEVRCPASFMGSHLTLGDGPDTIAGSFTTTPPGDWIVGKVFFGDGQGELFLALNPVTGQGEFLAKDPQLSAPVIQELGRLFHDIEPPFRAG